MARLALGCLALVCLVVTVVVGARPEPCGSQAPPGCTCSFNKEEVWCERLGLSATPRIGRTLARRVKIISLRFNDIEHLSLTFLDTLPHLEVLNLLEQSSPCLTLDYAPDEVDDVTLAGKKDLNKNE